MSWDDFYFNADENHDQHQNAHFDASYQQETYQNDDEYGEYHDGAYHNDHYPYEYDDNGDVGHEPYQQDSEYVTENGYENYAAENLAENGYQNYDAEGYYDTSNEYYEDPEAYHARTFSLDDTEYAEYGGDCPTGHEYISSHEQLEEEIFNSPPTSEVQVELNTDSKVRSFSEISESENHRNRLFSEYSETDDSLEESEISIRPPKRTDIAGGAAVVGLPPIKPTATVPTSSSALQLPLSQLNRPALLSPSTAPINEKGVAPMVSGPQHSAAPAPSPAPAPAPTPVPARVAIATTTNKTSPQTAPIKGKRKEKGDKRAKSDDPPTGTSVATQGTADASVSLSSANFGKAKVVTTAGESKGGGASDVRSPPSSPTKPKIQATLAAAAHPPVPAPTPAPAPAPAVTAAVAPKARGNVSVKNKDKVTDDDDDKDDDDDDDDDDRGAKEKASKPGARDNATTSSREVFKRVKTDFFLNAVLLTMYPSRMVYAASADSNIHGFDLNSGKELACFRGHIDRVLCLAMSTYRQFDAIAVPVNPKQKHLLVSGSRDEHIFIWDVDTYECLKSIKAHKGPVWAVEVVVTDSQAIIASCSDEGTIRLWNGTSGEKLNSLKGHKGNVLALNVLDGHTNAPRLISGGQDKKVRIWDLLTAEHIKMFEGHEEEVTCVNSGNFKSLTSMGADGKKGKLRPLAISGSKDHSIRVWDLNEAHALFVLHGHTAVVNAVTVGAPQKDSKVRARHPVFISVCDLGKVIFWNGDTGKMITSQRWHKSNGKGLATLYLPGDAMQNPQSVVASCSWDKSVRVRDLDEAVMEEEADCGCVVA